MLKKSALYLYILYNYYYMIDAIINYTCHLGCKKLTLQRFDLRTWATLWSSEVAAEQGGASRLFTGGTDFAMDNNTFAEAHIRAAFYPKFENEKSDQEVRELILASITL